MHRHRKTLIVTAASGTVQRPWAGRVAKRINSLYGDVPAIDISDITPWKDFVYPLEVKLHIWEIVPKWVDRLVWIDADTYVARPIFDEDLPTEVFCAVPDPWMATTLADNKAVGEYALYAQIPQYFNSGVIVSTRAAIPAFEYGIELFRQLDPKTVHFLREQDTFNWAVWTVLGGQRPNNPGWYGMDDDWNFMYKNRTRSNPKPIIVHLAGVKTPEKEATLKALYAGATI